MHLPELKNRLKANGLLVHGWLESEGQTLLLVGNAGSHLWPVFSSSSEYHDKLPDPLDRWSRRIGVELAKEIDAKVIFPFDGPPYLPFLDWASKAGISFQSPVAMFIHPKYGLWHAFRFALPVHEPFASLPVDTKPESPCITCIDQPCLDTCPVDAFGEDGYQLDRCVGYLHGNPDSTCVAAGCSARRACPVGRDFTYRPEQAQFHMAAFIASHPRKSP
jgi:epoxyqueuosine reductase QueG